MNADASIKFQSAPLTEARGDSGSVPLPKQGEPSFNPLPLPKQGETLPCHEQTSDFKKFQSAPLTEARGDMTSRNTIWSKSFNPLPLPKQGETHCQESDLTSFNPLPLPKQGETHFFDCSGPVREFQSAPLTEARGDFAVRSPYRSKGRLRAMTGKQGFNPLPLPKQGETSQIRHGCFSRPVSIRSPYRSKGRHVQIIGNKGRLKRGYIKFQSAPLTEARGDLDVRSSIGVQICFNPLPLPKQGETGTPEIVAMAKYRGFNPLPLPKQGETCADCTNQAFEGFNPLPLPKQGETFE